MLRTGANPGSHDQKLRVADPGCESETDPTSTINEISLGTLSSAVLGG
jgi:hypothetical protein